MAPTRILLPDSSSKCLITQEDNMPSPSPGSSSITTDSPGSEPGSSPPSQNLPHVAAAIVTHSHSDLSVPSSSSSSLGFVPEVSTSASSSSGPKRRKKKKKMTMMPPHSKSLSPTTKASEDRLDHHKSCKQVCRTRQPSSSSSSTTSFSDQKPKDNQHTMCCKCAAGYTADCAAVCCCPLALLHLAALTFIRLPTAVAWKMMVNLRNKMCVKRPPKSERGEAESPRAWSYGGSPEVLRPDRSSIVRFDSENLLEHFEAGKLDFGGFSDKAESP